MVGQAPSQNATQASSNVATAPRVLLEDSIFKSIHDAFQMGWNIIELKSRLQLASVSSNIAGIPTTVPVNKPDKFHTNTRANTKSSTECGACSSKFTSTRSEHHSTTSNHSNGSQTQSY